jgi:FdhE protein
MTVEATIRILPAEEIAARAGDGAPRIVWPQLKTVFAERAMRLRQLAHGHPMRDFLLFAAELAQTQQDALPLLESLPEPQAAIMVEGAERTSTQPFNAQQWPRHAAWRAVFGQMVQQLPGKLQSPAKEKVAALADKDAIWLEHQADRLLTGNTFGLDLAAAPVTAAALQVYWTHLTHFAATRFGAAGLDAETQGLCPCCGSLPTASVTRVTGGAAGQRYAHCALCSTQWLIPRIQCVHCGSTKSIAYESLQPAQGEAAGVAAVQAETCDDCGSYLKIMHTDRDPFVDPVADDLATLTLDLLVSDAGKQRYGVNFLLLFGDPEGSLPSSGGP